MSYLFKKVLILIITSLLITNTMALAQNNLKSTGIGFRGTFYSPQDGKSGVHISNHLGQSVNSTANTGGNLYVFSRFTETTLFEFTIGNISCVEQVATFVGSQKVDVFNMTPILFGIRYDFLQARSRGFLQPYISGGLGAYVCSDINLINRIMVNDVEVSTIVKPGLYAGGGLNIHLGTWIALNIDGKYQMINVNPNYKHSGFEFGFGFNFSWGSL